MAARTLVVVAVAAMVAAAAIGVIVYVEFFASNGQPVASENWAGYMDGVSQSSASGAFSLPTQSDWHGNGLAGLWVGMGGGIALGQIEWPFWQAGIVVTCSSGTCTGDLFDEGGTQGAPCNGTCPEDWTQSIGLAPGDTVYVQVSAGSSGATAHIVVNQDGFNTTYTPPPWAVLAGVTSFPSAEWIFESPEESGSVQVMPTLSPPGVSVSSLADSAGLSSMEPVVMTNNPNSQSVSVSGLNGGEFTAYSYDQ